MTHVFKVVQEAQYKRLEAISHPDWVLAMATLINSKKPDVFRWHDSGDVQDLDHLNKIFEVCRLTPSKRHWMPTREAWIKDHMHKAPANIVVRFSSPMIDQGPVKSWANTSTVSTKSRSCPALTTTTSAVAVELAGTRLSKILNMVNTSMTHVFKHPKFYRIPRDTSDQTISDTPPTGASERASGPGHKPQAPSSKPQASSFKPQAQKASSRKLQAPSNKRQA